MERHRLSSRRESSKEEDYRSRRDEKPTSDRGFHKNFMEASDVHGEKRQRRLQDLSPLEFSLKPRETDRMSEHEIRKTDVKNYRSTKLMLQHEERAYFQHDERYSRQSIGGTRRREYPDHSEWNDKHRSKDNLKEESDTVWRHDKFHESEASEPREKRKRVFREIKSVPEDTHPEGKASTITDKSEGHDKVQSRNDVKESQCEPKRWPEGQRDREQALTRGDHQRGRWLERDSRNDNFLSRGRYNSGRANGVRGRERFNMQRGPNERNAFRSQTSDNEKWKHDLFEQANRSPTPKNEEDQMAKIEALLAS